MSAPRPSLRAALRDPWLVAPIAVGLAIRVALAVYLDGEMILRGDEKIYTLKAAAFLDTGVLRTGVFVRPPLYFAFLAAARAIAESLSLSWLLTAKLIQCLASAATAVPIYRCATRIGGVRVGRIAAAIFLFDPTLIAFTHLLWPETLFTLLVAIVFDGAAKLDPRRPVATALSGAIAGLAMLLKPVFGLFTVVLALSWLRRLGWEPAMRLALVFGFAAAIVISPWVIRNQRLYGPAIILENQGPYNLWSGNAKASGERVFGRWRQLPDALTRSRVATRSGIEAIAADPARFARNVAVRSLNLWGLEYFVVRHLVNAGYGAVSRDTFLAVFWLIQLAWLGVLGSAALGLGPIARDPTLRCVLTYTVALMLLVSAMVSTTRFRVPLSFWISIAAALGIDRLIARKLTRRSLLVAALAVALIAASAARPMFWKIVSGDFSERSQLNRSEWQFFRY